MRENGYKEIRGYNLPEMIRYQFWIFLFELFVRSHFFSQNISFDIRHGKISSFLLYPFDFINYQLCLFLSDKMIQIFIGCFSVLMAFLFHWVDLPSMDSLLKAILFILMINIFLVLYPVIYRFSLFLAGGDMGP